MFDKYQNYLLISKDSFNLEHLGYYIKNDIYYPLTMDEKENVDIKIIVNDNSNIEKIVVTLNKREVYEEKVYLKEEKNINKTSESIWQKILHIFHKIF